MLFITSIFDKMYTENVRDSQKDNNMWDTRILIKAIAHCSHYRVTGGKHTLPTYYAMWWNNFLSNNLFLNSLVFSHKISFIFILCTIVLSVFYKDISWKQRCISRNEHAPSKIISTHCLNTEQLGMGSKLYIPSTLNITLIQWHTQLNVCAVK